MSSSISGTVQVKIKTESTKFGYKGDWKQVRCTVQCETDSADSFMEQYKIQICGDAGNNKVEVEDYLIGPDTELKLVPVSKEFERNHVFSISRLKYVEAEFSLNLSSTSIDDFDVIIYVSVFTSRNKTEWMEAIAEAINCTRRQYDSHIPESTVYQPDLWATAIRPSVDLDIRFPYNSNSIDDTDEWEAVNHGNTIIPSHVINAPKIAFSGMRINSKDDIKYEDSLFKNLHALIMFDLDRIYGSEAPDSASRGKTTPKKENYNGYLHWAVVNIGMMGSDNSESCGEEVIPYEPPAPPIRSGLHRYFFLLFRQREAFSESKLEQLTEYLSCREKFSYVTWANTMDLQDPVGVNGFYSMWEPDHCEKLHARLGYTPPEQFRSPRQQLEISLREKNQVIEKAKISLYEDLALADILPPITPKRKMNSFPSSIALNVLYSDVPGTNNLEANEGQILSSNRLRKAPKVSYKCRSGGSAEMSHFTLLLSDPDCPSRVNHSMREFVHWVVVNIPGDRISEGVEVLPYLAAAPPPGSGLHRYVFMLYLQHSVLDETQITTCQDYFRGRSGLHTNQFLTSLVKDAVPIIEPTPVAIDAFLAEWEEGVENIYAAMGVSLPSPYSKLPSSPKVKRVDSQTSNPPQSPPLQSPDLPSPSATPLPLHSSPPVVVEYPVVIEIQPISTPTKISEPVQSKHNSPQEEVVVQISQIPDTAAVPPTATSLSNKTHEMVATSSPSSDSDSSCSPSQDDTLTCSSDDVLPIISNVLDLEKEAVLETSCADAKAAGALIGTAILDTSHHLNPPVTSMRNSVDLSTTKGAIKPLTSEELCKSFGVKFASIFDGEPLKKKFSTDFMFKESFIWINPATKTLHWAKSLNEKENPRNSKYLSLCGPTARPISQSATLGEFKGVVAKVKANEKSNGIHLLTSSEEYLEIKTNPAKAEEMLKVIQSTMLRQ